MSQLREQLQAGREKHRSQRYPGDLAAELLPQSRHPVLKIFTAAAAISAVAAAMVLWVGSRPITTQTGPGKEIAVKTTTTQPVETQPDDGSASPVTALASVPEFPEDVPMAPTMETDDVPMAPSFDSMEIGAIPSLPSMDMNFTAGDTTSGSQSKTSKEST